MKIDFQSSSKNHLKLTGYVSSLFLIAASAYHIAPTDNAFVVALCTGGAAGVTTIAIAAINAAREFGKTIETMDGCNHSY